MEIKNTNQNGVSKVNGLLRIKYAISIKEDEVRSFTGQIMNEDVCVGFCNASNTGVIGFSLSEDNGLTDEEIKAVAASLSKMSPNLLARRQTRKPIRLIRMVRNNPDN